MSQPVGSTKHFQISKTLGERIKYMMPGDYLPTLAELMSEFDASQGTIAQALGRLRSQGLVSKPAGKKRLVVSKQQQKALFRIVLIRPSWPSPDYDAVQYAIQVEGFHQHFGFDIYCYTSMDSLDLDRAVGTSDAAFFVSSSEPFPDHLKKAIPAFRKPIIFLREKPEDIDAPEICIDDYNSGITAVKHLADLGHRNILAITSEPPTVSSNQRLNGWRDALRELNVPDYENLLVDCSVRPGQYSLTGAYESLRYWVARNSKTKFTAAFCVSWTGALAALRCFRENNIRVPEDVSVITNAGEGGAISDFMNPPLSTIEFDVKEYAIAAISLVQDILKRPDPAPPQIIKVGTFLMPRLSSRLYTPAP